MAFRKRNVAIQRAPEGQSIPPTPQTVELTGLRPSPLTGQRVTSTGIASLDGCLGGHSGLALGSSLLIEESGTTDFSGTLLKFFAAEGIAQGHHLHVVGVGQQWTRELPGLAGISEAPVTASSDDKMKIAWRYERLGQHDAATSRSHTTASDQVFCHSFDLAKKLAITPTAAINHVPASTMTPHSQSPFTAIMHNILNQITTSPPTSVHRIIIPSLLSPAFYPPHAAAPAHLLEFMHSIRALQRRYPERTSVMASVPTELYSRTSGTIRWLEHLCDGVIELQPFPHLLDAASSLAESGGARTGEEQPQGMLKFHKLPALTERGAGSSGTVGVGDDLTFTLSRRKFVVRPFSLPPMEQEQNETPSTGSKESSGMSNIKKSDIEF